MSNVEFLARTVNEGLPSYSSSLSPVTSGGWTPGSLTNLVAWYDMSQTAHITSSGGTASQVDDLSGNAHHLTQPTAANQPTTGSRTVNGLNGLGFNGSAAPNTSYMTASIGTLTQPFTQFMVISFDVISHNNVIMDGNNALGRSQSYKESDNTLKMYSGSPANTGQAITTGAQEWVTMFNGASSKAFFAGTQVGTTWNPGTNSMIDLSVGWDQPHTGSYMMQGIICELAVALGDHSTDVASWASYTLSKWGV